MSCRRRVSGRGFADGIFFRAFVRQCQKADPSGCALAGPLRQRKKDQLAEQLRASDSWRGTTDG
jgi:hypothetical protein